MRFTPYRYIYILILSIFLVPRYSSGQEVFKSEIDSDAITNALRQHIEYLCSPRLYGRSTVTGHDHMASQYIDSIYGSLGLSVYSSYSHYPYYQHYNIVQTVPLQRTLVTPHRIFEYGRDFLNLGPDPAKNIEYEVVFGGLGEYDEIDSLDLKGKALLILSNNLRVAGMKVEEHAKSKGCAMVMVANPSSSKQFFYISQQLSDNHNSIQYRVADEKPKPLSRFFARFGDPIPQLLISDDLAEYLLREKPLNIWKRLQSKEPKGRPAVNSIVKFDYHFLNDTIPTQNVIGFIPAARINQQSVILGAHFDHLTPEGQRWFPGADDNASGTAVMIEVARLLANDYQNGYMPNRNIVFAGFSAEEIGLLGSQHYYNNPLFPVENTTVMLNLDMVGRLGKQSEAKKSVYLGGSNRLKEFSESMQTVNSDSTIVIDSESLAGISLFTLSDHYHFDNRGLPAYLITTGMHNDYHKSSDTPEKLSIEGMQDMVKLIYQTVRHFADSENPWEIL
ncbi:MAG: M28 family peptidase [Tenuifilaceae bacterium]|jgi:hypothetical protein|nr:M28 family peptidase [Tenuifilaceae bacterium]